MGALNSHTRAAGGPPNFVPHDRRVMEEGMEVTAPPETLAREPGAGGELALGPSQGNLLALASGITGFPAQLVSEAGADEATRDKVVSFVWGVADEVLADLFKRGKYPEVILPMCVLRRLDAVLEPSRKAVLETKEMLDKAGITEQKAELCQASGHAFYNTSKFILRDLKSGGGRRQLRRDFEAYLNGFSPNVQDILDNFKFPSHVATLSRADVLGILIDKFLDPEINFSPNPVLNADRSVRQPPLDNHSMSAVFEELVRKFDEENIEDASEHRTPSDVVTLMANLVFQPVADAIQSGSYRLYDGACGAGGMLTAAENTLQDVAAKHGKQVTAHLYGQEIDPRTYAICKARILLKGEDDHAEHIAGGGQSTLSHDAFPAEEFDFMVSNPSCDQSWRRDRDAMGGKEGMRDPRFRIAYRDDPDYSLGTRSSDGQMLFLANMASKMNHNSPLGSRIAVVQSESSLLTGSAGQGESNIRRWIIENDWLEAIIALPSNIFYNAGAGNYVWVLSNRKAPARRGKVQVIDATNWSQPLEKNLGEKTRELSAEDVQRICNVFMAFEPGPESKLLENKALGYWKVTVERPLRLHSQLKRSAIESLRFASGEEAIRAKLFSEFGEKLLSDFDSIRPAVERRVMEQGSSGEDATVEKRRKKLLDPATWKRDNRLFETALALQRDLGDGLFEDHNLFKQLVDTALDRVGAKVSTAEVKLILRAVSWRDESAPPVIAKIHKSSKAEAGPLHGIFEQRIAGKRCVVEYEPVSELRDTKQVPLLEPGGIEAFFRREVLPQYKDAWIAQDSTKVGYEIAFHGFFHPAISIQPEATSIVAAPAPAWKQWEGDLAGGEFPLEQFLAASENGAVFRTRLTSGDGAIKLVPAGNAQAEELVEQWNRAALLEHPHFIKIVKTGTWANAGVSLAYVVMEYAEENLETVLMERALTPGETLEMLQPVAKVLAFLHGRGLVHGHLKPSNVFAVKDTLKISSDAVPVGDASADLRALAAIVVQALTQRTVTFTEGDSHTSVVDSLPHDFREIVRNCAGLDGRVQWSAARLADALRLQERATSAVPALEGAALVGSTLLDSTVAIQPRPMLVYRYKRKTSRLTYYALAFALIAVVVVTVGGLLRNRTADATPAAAQPSGKTVEPAVIATPPPAPAKMEPATVEAVKKPAPVRETRPPRAVE
ncbi:MAG: N-6 DNA methylase, partial [Bryobacteraceae bacterium]